MAHINFKYLVTAVLAVSALSAWAVRPQIVAHRGHWKPAGSAQNSIRGLIKADSICADAVELDVWMSADSVLYVNHDPAINGVTIETSDTKTLSKIKLPNGEALPTLESYLDVAKNLRPDIVLEVKTHANPAHEDCAVEKIVKMVADKGLTNRTTYITFSRNAFDDLVAISGRPVQFLSAMDPDALKNAGGAAADYHISVFRSNPQWIKRLHELGLKVNIWTVDSQTDIQWCIDHEADYITTDEPELAQQLVDKACSPRELTVMTYNLRFGELSDMAGLAAEINKYKPDFVALQEVDVNTNRVASKHNNGLNYVIELAQRTGMFGYYGRAIDLGPGYYGVGILSRFPAEKLEKFELPNPGNEEPRVLLMGLFEMPGRKIVFASTHFDYIDHATRKAQAQFVAGKITSTSYPAMLAGDFNSNSDRIYIKTITAKMKDLTNDTKTWPANNPEDKLDFIFGYPADDFELKSCFVPAPSAKAPSDHLPVISKITVNFE